MPSRLSCLELLKLENVIRSGRRLGFLPRHFSIHVGDVIIHIDNFIVILVGRLLRCGPARATVHVQFIDVVIHVLHLASLACIRRSCFKPAVFQSYFLDGTGS